MTVAADAPLRDETAAPQTEPAGVAIELRGLEKRFGDVAAVAGVDLSVPPGAFLVLLGPSGCGKTTLLRMLSGLEEPSAGEIRFGDRVVASGAGGTLVPAGRRGAGLVFQSYALWPHMTVRQNVEWPLKVQRWPADRRRERVRGVLALLAIAELGDRYPGEISGGQQQRVAIARMIGPKPQVLFFDEPLSNLDAKLRAEMRTELLRVHRLTGATSVYVTHDQVEAMTMATHVAVMNGGRVDQFGSPKELLAAPATSFVATFVGTPPANLIRATVADGRFRHEDIDLGLAEGRAEASSWLLMYRANDLRLDGEPGSGAMPVDFAEATPVAGRAIVTVWAEGRRVTVVTETTPDARLGDRLHLRFPDSPSGVFADDASIAG